MVDTFRPLRLGEGARASDDGRYAWTWSGRGPATAMTRLDRGRVRARSPAVRRRAHRKSTSRCRQISRSTARFVDNRRRAVRRRHPRRLPRRRPRHLARRCARPSATRSGRPHALLALAEATPVLAVHRRRLRRLLRLGAARDQRRTDLPARAPSRSPRTGSTCRSATTAAPAPSSSRAPPVRRPRGQFPSPAGPRRVRPDPQARLRGRGRVRRRRGRARPACRSPSTRFAEHVFGLTLLNDWSARDIQGFETVPLGPHLGKSFATSVSAWITPLDALDRAWRPPPPRDVAPPRHLDDGDLPGGLDLELTVSINGAVVSRPPFATMYWTPGQLLAHLTSNGAPARTGDLFGSGTVSGPDRDQFGSLLELTWNGTDPIAVGDGSPHLARGRRRGRDHRVGAGQRRRPTRPRRGARRDPIRLTWRPAPRRVQLAVAAAHAR